jgi:hypothetical protein
LRSGLQLMRKRSCDPRAVERTYAMM